jgi:hypothetical protein
MLLIETMAIPKEGLETYERTINTNKVSKIASPPLIMM